MTPEAILSFLKFGGPIVGLASAVWSTTQKITQEGANGVKRLTLQGRVLIGIIALSTLISILALGFETVIGRQTAAEKKEAEKEKRENDRMLVAEKRQARDDAVARDQAAALARLEADSVEQKRFLEQGLLISAKAAEQQRRDAQISLQFAREANLRASDAEQQSAELGRVNYPLRNIDSEVRLSLDFTGVASRPEMIQFWSQVAEADHKEWQSTPVSRRSLEYEEGTVTLNAETFKTNSTIQNGTRGTLISLSFVTPSDGLNPPTSYAGDVIRPVDQRTEIDRIDIPVLELRDVSITANLRDRSMTASYYGSKLIPDGVVGRKKVSVSDLNKLVPILTIERRAKDGSHKRPPDTLKYVSFSVNGLGVFSDYTKEMITDEHSFILHLKPPQ